MTQTPTLSPLLEILSARFQEAGHDLAEALDLAAGTALAFKRDKKLPERSRTLAVGALRSWESSTGRAYADLPVVELRPADVRLLREAAEHRMVLAEGLLEVLLDRDDDVLGRAVEHAQKFLRVAEQDVSALRTVLDEQVRVEKLLLLGLPRLEEMRSASGGGGSAASPGSTLAASAHPNPVQKAVAATRTRSGAKPGGNTGFERQHPRGRGGEWIAKGEGYGQEGPSPRVKQLQERLRELGFQVNSDGQFGVHTEEAVKAFQRKYGLDETGKIDANTVEVLRNPPPKTVEQVKKADAAAEAGKGKTKTKATKGSTSSRGSSSGSRSPSSGSRAGTSSSLVRRGDGMTGKEDASTLKIQQALDALGYELGPGGTDGRFGEDTLKAVEMLQRRYGLRVDGVVGPQTKKMIERLLRKQKQGEPGNLSVDQLATPTKRGRSTARSRLQHSAPTELDEEDDMQDDQRTEEASYVDVKPPTPMGVRVPYGGAAEFEAPTIWPGDPAARTPGMDDFMGQEPPQMPPNLHEQDELSFQMCGTCVHHNGKRLCGLYSAGTDRDDVCDSWYTLTPPEQRNRALAYVVSANTVQEARESGDGTKLTVALRQLAHARELLEAAVEEASPEYEKLVKKFTGKGMPEAAAKKAARKVLGKRRVSEAERGLYGIDLDETNGWLKLRCEECDHVQPLADQCEECGHEFDPLVREVLLDDAADALDGWLLDEATLTADKRKKLPKSSFAVPEKDAYPIHDEAHARNALARVSQHGTPEEKKKVRAAVRRRYPKIVQEAVALVEVKSSAYPSLERKPGKQNWVDYAGGLPSYIERIAKHIHYEGGRPIGAAIAAAVNTVRRWCAGGSVTKTGASTSSVSAATKAKACAALAQWEAAKKKGSAAMKAREAADETAPEELEPGVLAVMQALHEIESLDSDVIDEATAEQALQWLQEDELEESAFKRSLHFDPRLHPRDREGEFREVFRALNKLGYDEITMPHGVSVRKRAGGLFMVKKGGRPVHVGSNPNAIAKHAVNATGIPERPRERLSPGIQTPRFASAFEKGTNADVISMVFEGRKESRKGKNLYTQPSPVAGITTMMSYREPLALVDHPRREVHVNVHKYSPTTSRHRSQIEDAARQSGYAVTHIDRAEARTRAGLPDEPFHKMTVSEKYDPGSEAAPGAWRKAETKLTDMESHYRTMPSGRQEALIRRPDNTWVHMEMTRNGRLADSRAMREEDARKLLSGDVQAMVQLQSYGAHPAKKAGDVKVGEHRVYNFGISSPVVKVERKGGFVHITVQDSQGKEHTHKKKPDTLVATADRPTGTVESPATGMTGLLERKYGKKLSDGTYVEVEAKLHRIGDQPPYFSVTGTHWKSEQYAKGSRADRGVLSGGQVEALDKHFPELKAVRALHLSDEHGVPMHAVENGWYWYSDYNGAGVHELADSPFAKMTPHERAADYLRVSPERLPKGMSKQEFTAFAETLKPEWRRQADEARRVLQGDQETHSPATATRLAPNVKSVDPPRQIGGEKFQSMSDSELAAELKRVNTRERASLSAEKGSDLRSEWMGLISKKHNLENESRRRKLQSVTPREDHVDVLGKMREGNTTQLATIEVRRHPGDVFEVFERDRSSRSSTYGIFTGSKEDVARYAGRNLERAREFQRQRDRSSSTGTLPVPKRKGDRLPPTLSLGLVPDDWAVQHGYAEYIESPIRAYTGYHAFNVPGETAKSIRWKPGTDAEKVLYHYLGGRKAPANYDPNSIAGRQWAYTGEGGKKADRMALVKKLTEATLQELALALRFTAAADHPSVSDMWLVEDAHVTMARLPVARLLIDSKGTPDVLVEAVQDVLRERLAAVTPDAEARLQEAREAKEPAKVKLYETLLEALG